MKWVNAQAAQTALEGAKNRVSDILGGLYGLLSVESAAADADSQKRHLYCLYVYVCLIFSLILIRDYSHRQRFATTPAFEVDTLGHCWNSLDSLQADNCAQVCVCVSITRFSSVCLSFSLSVCLFSIWRLDTVCCCCWDDQDTCHTLNRSNWNAFCCCCCPCGEVH